MLLCFFFFFFVSQEATASILAHICNTGTPIAVKTKHIAVYPGCLPWKSAVYNKLEFSHGERELKSHPQVIFLLIHIYEVPPPPTRNGKQKTCMSDCIIIILNMISYPLCLALRIRGACYVEKKSGLSDERCLFQHSFDCVFFRWGLYGR